MRTTETVIHDPSIRALYQIVSSGMFPYHIRKNWEKAM